MGPRIQLVQHIRVNAQAEGLRIQLVRKLQSCGKLAEYALTTSHQVPYRKQGLISMLISPGTPFLVLLIRLIPPSEVRTITLARFAWRPPSKWNFSLVATSWLVQHARRNWVLAALCAQLRFGKPALFRSRGLFVLFCTLLSIYDSLVGKCCRWAVLGFWVTFALALCYFLSSGWVLLIVAGLHASLSCSCCILVFFLAALFSLALDFGTAGPLIISTIPYV